MTGVILRAIFSPQGIGSFGLLLDIAGAVLLSGTGCPRTSTEGGGLSSSIIVVPIKRESGPGSMIGWGSSASRS